MPVISLGDLWDALVAAVGKHVAQFIAGVVVLILIEILRRLWKLVFRMIRYYQRLERARRAVRRVESSAGGWIEGKGLWTSERPIRPPNYAMAIAASKVLIVANAKGGVGKTTVCASLGARFSEILDKPVLMIDLDFQGSLSSMSIADKSDWLPSEGLDSQATYLISGDLSPRDVASTGKHGYRENAARGPGWGGAPFSLTQNFRVHLILGGQTFLVQKFGSSGCALKTLGALTSWLAASSMAAR